MNKQGKAIILVIDTIPVKQRDGRPMKTKRWWAQHKSHKSANGEAFQISTRSTKNTFTLTVFNMMSQNDLMQGAKPASKTIVKHTNTKPAKTMKPNLDGK